MKVVNKTVVALLLIVLPLMAFAQEGPPDRGPKKERKADMLAYLQKKLELTTDQAAKIKTIEDSYAQERQELHNKMKALHDEMKAMRDKQKKEIDEVLTVQQKAQLEKLRAERAKKMGERRAKMGKKMRERNP